MPKNNVNDIAFAGRDNYEETTPGTDGPSLIKQDNSNFLNSIINENVADKTPV